MEAVSVVLGLGCSPKWRNEESGPMTNGIVLTRRRLCVGVATSSSTDAVNSLQLSGRTCFMKAEHNRYCGCECGRRQMLASVLGTALAASSRDKSHNIATARTSDYQQTMELIHPKRPDWYEEFYAQSMDSGMKSYEEEVTSYKEKLFEPLRNGDAKTVLELGVGTGPNLKHYVNRSVSDVIGIDPNKKMEKYARAAAANAGLSDSQFKFVNAVAEVIPLPNSSMDTVISTLVLCSVKDVASTLREVKRVLKPGGTFYFMEHVGAPEGSTLRFWQNVFDPLQQFVADGCHLTRDTLSYIENASFADVASQAISVKNASLISPHVIGVAQSEKI